MGETQDASIPPSRLNRSLSQPMRSLRLDLPPSRVTRKVQSPVTEKAKRLEQQTLSQPPKHMATSASGIPELSLLEQHVLEMKRNTSMARERTLEEYEQLLGVDIKDMALKTIDQKGHFTWVDMCCGRFNAGRDLMDELTAERGEGILSQVTAVGIDLVKPLPERAIIGRRAIIARADVVTYPLPEDTDLITCYKGLIWVNKVPGRAMEAVQNWYNALPINSTLVIEDTDLSSNLPWGKFVEELTSELGNSVTTQTNKSDMRLVQQKPGVHRRIDPAAHVVKIVKKNPKNLSLASLAA